MKIKALILAVTLTAIIMTLCFMMNNVAGPPWDPAGNVPFRTWAHNVQLWVNVSSSRLAPHQQASAIILGLRGVAGEFARTIPQGALQFGAAIQGTHTDPVTYLMYTLQQRFGPLEDERALSAGTVLLDFAARRNFTRCAHSYVPWATS